MRLETIWFLQKPIDLEAKQYLVMAYLRDARQELRDNKLGLYQDLKRILQNLECFRTTRTIVSELGAKDRKILKDFNKLPDDHADVIEAKAIVKYATDELESLRKEFNTLWRKIESSFNLYYMGERPLIVESGFLLVKYGGSPIIETYRFTVEFGKVKTELYEYIEGECEGIRDQLEDMYPGSVFIVADSLIAYNTPDTAMPFLLEILEKKVVARK